MARIEYCIEEPHVYQNEKGEWVTDVASVFIDGAEGNFYPRPADNTWNIDIYTDNSVVVVYVNGTSCFTSRIYGLTKNCWSINTYEGSISVDLQKDVQFSSFIIIKWLNETFISHLERFVLL